MRSSGRASERSSERSAGRKKQIAILVMVVLAVAIFLTVSGVQIVRMNHKNRELEARKERLEQLLAEEMARTEQLEEREVYVQTQKYIEEKAKSIGYVYPDEIIFREDD